MENTTPEHSHKKSSDNVITIASVALFILASFGVIVFLYNQNQSLKEELAGYKTESIISPTPSSTPVLNITELEDSSVSASPTIISTSKPSATPSATNN